MGYLYVTWLDGTTSRYDWITSLETGDDVVYVGFANTRAYHGPIEIRGPMQKIEVRET